MSFKRKRFGGDDEFDTQETATPEETTEDLTELFPRTAPTVKAVKAYWAQGREGHEAEVIMEQYKTKDAVTGADIYYIPERDPETLEELPAPTDLTGQLAGEDE